MTKKESLQKIVDTAAAQTTIFSRQLGIFDPHKYKLSMSIVGVGAVGSVVAVAAAKLGISEIEIYDFDTVEDVNLPIQMHSRSSIGKNKAEASKELIDSLMPGVKLYVRPFKWTGEALKSDIVVSGADSLEVRKAVWESVKYDPAVKILCDARIGGQLIKLYYINPSDRKDIKMYDDTFPVGDMKGSELPCAERGVIDVSFFSAAMHIRAIRRWIVKGEKEPYLAYNLSGEMKSCVMA